MLGEGHTGFDGLAVNQHQALRTLPIGAKQAQWGAVFRVMAEDVDTIGD